MTAPRIEPPPEVTQLSPKQETQFQQWAKKNKITDVDAPDSFYDYRGFWLERGPVPIRFGRDPFPDTYKQHGHPTFSVESQYSKGPNDGGTWVGERFIPARQLGALRALGVPIDASMARPTPSDKINQAKQQIERQGITSEQREGYVPRLSEALFHYVIPFGYDGHTGQITKAILHAASGLPIPDTNSSTGEDHPELARNIAKIPLIHRNDAWRLFLGLPQKDKTFGVSSFQPTRSTEDRPYYKLNNFLSAQARYYGSAKEFIRDKVEAMGGRVGEALPAEDVQQAVMGNYTYGLGKDVRGTYLSYYDKWDLAPAGANRIGRPFEVYDRIYYDPKTYKPIPEEQLPKIDDRGAKFLRAMLGVSK